MAELSQELLNGEPDPTSGLSADSMRGSEHHIEQFKQNSDGNDPPGVFIVTATDPRTGKPYIDGTPAKMEQERLKPAQEKPEPATAETPRTTRNIARD